MKYLCFILLVLLVMVVFDFRLNSEIKEPLIITESTEDKVITSASFAPTITIGDGGEEYTIFLPEGRVRE